MEAWIQHMKLLQTQGVIDCSLTVRLSPPHTVTTLRDCSREDWLATHEDWLATGISTSFWRLQKTEHVRSSVPTSCRLQVAQSLHSVRLALELVWYCYLRLLRTELAKVKTEWNSHHIRNTSTFISEACRPGCL